MELSGSAEREQVGALLAQHHLAQYGDGLVVGPLPYCPASDAEKPGKLCVCFDAESGLYGAFGHVHAAQSRALDPLVKPSSRLARYGPSPMDTMADRLKRAMVLRGMSAARLMKATGLSKAAVYFLLDGTTKAETVRATTVNALCSVLRVSRDWLLYGKGPIEGEATASPESEWTDIQGFAQAVGLGNGAEAQEYAETHALKFRAQSLLRKRLKQDNLAVMYGDGDSMEPRIKSGDAVLFDTKDTKPRDGSMFVILWRGEYYVKRAMILDDAVYFTTDNPRGDHNWKGPKRMDAPRDPITILGRVRWIGSWEE